MALYRIQPGVNSDIMLWTIHDIRDNSRFTLQPIQYHTSLPNKDNVLLKDNINKILLIFFRISMLIFVYLHLLNQLSITIGITFLHSNTKLFMDFSNYDLH
jgi:hypothetical protein